MGGVEGEVAQEIETRSDPIRRRPRGIGVRDKAKAENGHLMGVEVVGDGADEEAGVVDVPVRTEAHPRPLRAEISPRDSNQRPEYDFQGLKIGAD